MAKKPPFALYIFVYLVRSFLGMPTEENTVKSQVMMLAIL